MEFSIIKDAFESAGYAVRSYSGRCMYGRKCLGVVTSHSGANVVCRVVREFIDYNQGDEDSEALEQVSCLLDTLTDALEDSMGRSGIVYWPDIEWPEGVEDSDDDDSDE